MTEHEKLLAGLDYDYTNPEIQRMLSKARKLLRQFNDSDDPCEHTEILRRLLGKCGRNVAIQVPFRLVYGCHLSVGNDVFINSGCSFLDSSLITIGDRVLIAPDVKIYCGNHSLRAEERFRKNADGSVTLITNVKPVTIGDDVWIGGNATILPGVTIGSNVVIGAGSVVTKDVADNCLAAGVPARIIRALPKRTDEQNLENI
jgi:maltose O-acetyltransferase